VQVRRSLTFIQPEGERPFYGRHLIEGTRQDSGGSSSGSASAVSCGLVISQLGQYRRVVGFQQAIVVSSVCALLMASYLLQV
jgi:hypothetical protein